jgi:hypothetical protein
VPPGVAALSQDGSLIGYQCARCHQALRVPLPGACPHCLAELGDPLPSYDPERASQAALLRETIAAFVDENSGFVIVALLAVFALGGFWWYHFGTNPEVAAAVGGIGRGLMIALKAVLMAVAIGAVVWIGRRFAWRRWRGLPTLARRGAIIGVSALCLIVAGLYVSGSPRRASRQAFAALRSLDQSGAAQEPAPYDAVFRGFQSGDSGAAMGALVKITPYLFAEDGSGPWLRTGRIVKYFCSLRPEDPQALDVLSKLAEEPPTDAAPTQWRSGCRALRTVAKQYRRSRALRESCYDDLAERLGVQSDPQSVFKGVDDYHTQVLAWEGERARQQQAAAQQRQARAARAASVRNQSAPARSYAWQTRDCEMCQGTGKCCVCRGTGVKSVSQDVLQRCSSCNGTGRDGDSLNPCGMCGGSGFRTRSVSVAKVCDACRGTGVCSTCGGTRRYSAPVGKW